MATRTLYFRLGDRHSITLTDLKMALQRITGVLADLDAAVSGNPNGAVRWRVTVLEKQSPPVLGVVAEPIARRDKLTRQTTKRDTSPQVEAALIGGVHTLNNCERPQEVPDAAIDKIQGLAVQSRRMGDIQVYTDDSRAAISETTLSGIRKVIGSATRSKGSILGRLDTIAVHHDNEFRVWDENSSRAVRCRFDLDMEDEVKRLLRQRVLVSGMVAFNARGQAVSVAVERLTEYETSPLPTIKEMSGFFKKSGESDFSVGRYLEHLRYGR